MAFGAICQAVQDKTGIPEVTAMYPENRGVELYGKEVYILRTGNSAASACSILLKPANFALKIAKGQEIGFPEKEGCIPQGRRGGKDRCGASSRNVPEENEGRVP